MSEVLSNRLPLPTVAESAGTAFSGAGAVSLPLPEPAAGMAAYLAERELGRRERDAVLRADRGTRLERVPIDREEVPVQISRLLEAHNVILKDARDLADKANDLGDVGTNDLLASSVVRTNEMQVWFVSEHLVEMPLVFAR